MFHYASAYFPFDKPVLHYFISHANLGVCYFFVLSGFILTIVYDEDYFFKAGAFKKFFVARFARIYPVYFLALFLSVASILLYNKGKFLLASLVSNALLIQAWIPTHVKVYNTPGWSLSAEAFFYLIFPYLIYKICRNSIARSATFAAIAWALGVCLLLYFFYWWPSFNNQSTRFIITVNPLLQVNNFLVGIAGGIAYRLNKPSIIRNYSLTFLLGSFASLLFLFFIPNPITENAQNGLLAPIFIVFILSLSYHKGVISRVLSNRYLIYLGDISYSIYILQIPLSFWYAGLIKKLQIELTAATFIYIYIVFLILFSALCYSYFEKPFRKYVRSLL